MIRRWRSTTSSPPKQHLRVHAGRLRQRQVCGRLRQDDRTCAGIQLPGLAGSFDRRHDRRWGPHAPLSRNQCAGSMVASLAPRPSRATACSIECPRGQRQSDVEPRPRAWCANPADQSTSKVTGVFPCPAAWPRRGPAPDMFGRRMYRQRYRSAGPGESRGTAIALRRAPGSTPATAG